MYRGRRRLIFIVNLSEESEIWDMIKNIFRNTEIHFKNFNQTGTNDHKHISNVRTNSTISYK